MMIHPDTGSPVDRARARHAHRRAWERVIRRYRAYLAVFHATGRVWGPECDLWREADELAGRLERRMGMAA